MKGRDNILWKTKPLLEMVNKPWKNFLADDVHEPKIELFRKYERIGRLLGWIPLSEKWNLFWIAD